MRTAFLPVAIFGVVAVSPAWAESFNAQLTYQPLEVRSAQMPAGGVKKIVVAALRGVVSSKTTAGINGGVGSMHATQVVPETGKPKVFGHSIMRAVDGSVLYLYFEGLPASAAPDKIGRGTWQAIRGIGRFEKAAGSGNWTFQASKAGPVQTFSGSLKY